MNQCRTNDVHDALKLKALRVQIKPVLMSSSGAISSRSTRPSWFSQNESLTFARLY
jgi:hypothetical protein